MQDTRTPWHDGAAHSVKTAFEKPAPNRRMFPLLLVAVAAGAAIKRRSRQAWRIVDQMQRNVREWVEDNRHPEHHRSAHGPSFRPEKRPVDKKEFRGKTTLRVRIMMSQLRLDVELEAFQRSSVQLSHQIAAAG
jgi:transposase